MPVAGDATRFSLGLMAFLHDSLAELRLPIWNDLWGYGFPGLAESQMGVYYPPHLALYGLLPTTAAYTASLVLHTLWGALGVFWAGRRFGATDWSAALGAFAWSASGFFVIHLSHQWGYTVGSWMPWALGLAWPLARGQGSIREALLLAAALTLQVLPGHFQLAFVTQVSVLGLALWGLAERPSGWRRAAAGAFGITGAVGAVLVLGAMQLLPTWELARLAGAQHDFEYLSGFATAPPLLLSYLSPALFHASPLWRPLVWDTLHTSPEEHMASIGIVPLFLALVALVRCWRSEPASRALGWLAAGSLWLSFGPYALGFRALIELPGFSFFRAPARWGLATELALVLLAMRGFDLLLKGEVPRLGRLATRFVLGAMLLLGLAVGVIELAFQATEPGRGWRRAIDGLEAPLRWLPFDTSPRLPNLMRGARSRPTDALVVEGLRRRGEDPSRVRLDRDRGSIYLEELTPAVLVLGALLVLASRRAQLDRRSRALIPAGLAGLTFLELMVTGSTLSTVEYAPLQDVQSASPVLARLAKEPRGQLVQSELGNLAMASGVAGVPPYRTLDRPVRWPLEGFSGVRLYRGSRDPYRSIGEEALANEGETRETIQDPTLLNWLGGGFDPRGEAAASWTLSRTSAPFSRVWLFQGGLADLQRHLSGNLNDRFRWNRQQWPSQARPLSWSRGSPENLRVEVEVNKGPATVVLAVLDDPEWQASWVSKPGGDSLPAVLQPILREEAGSGGWMAVESPGAGEWTLELTYRGQAVARGQAVSSVAWAAWLLAYWWAGSRRRRRAVSGAGDVQEKEGRQ